MADVLRSMRRPTAILKMPDAIARGLTPTAFLKELRSQGLGYRYQRFLQDWHNVSGTEARKDRYKFVRKDRQFTSTLMPDVDWGIDKEFMYKYKVWSRTRPDEPLTERHVNIVTDNNLTPTEQEVELFSRWEAWENYYPERIERFELIGAWHRVEALEEPSPSPFERQA